MSLFHPIVLTVKRESAGEYVNGMWVPGTPESDFTINASWQPANGKDLQVLSEGERLRVVYKGYTDTKLYPSDPKTQSDGDKIVSPDGLEYEVIRVENWQNNLLNHYKFMAVRDKEGA